MASRQLTADSKKKQEVDSRKLKAECRTKAGIKGAGIQEAGIKDAER